MLRNKSVVLIIAALLIFGGVVLDAAKLYDKIISSCGIRKDWEVQKFGRTRALRKIVDAGKDKAVEVKFTMAYPNLNSGDLLSGFALELKTADFEIKPDEALSIILLWEGGKNNMRVELKDWNGIGRMKEFSDLHETEGWQEITITKEELELWGEKSSQGEIGRVRELKFVVFYSWTSGKGRLLIDEVRVVKKPKIVEPVIAVSQLGYHPDDQKRIVVNLDERKKKKGTFRIMKLSSQEVVLEEPLEHVQFTDWAGQHYVGDFSKITEEGRYQAEVSFGKDSSHRTEVFSIKRNIFDKMTSYISFDFLRTMRSEDPLTYGFSDMGGYRDAGTMHARYLNTNTHLVYGVGRYILAKNLPRQEAPKIKYAIDELKYGVKSMIAWQMGDGSIVDSIIRKPDIYPHNMLPEDNTRPWKVEKEGMTVLSYAAAMATASRALAPYDSALSSGAAVAAKRAYEWAGTKKLPNTSGSIGNYLWDSIEMYRLTNDSAYLDKARGFAKTLLSRQFLDFTRAPERICGNLLYSSRSDEFYNQYKMFLDSGMYLGMIELFSMLDDTDIMYGDLRYFLKTFADHYLLKMSSLTPYLQIAEGLELKKSGLYDVSYFHPPTGRLGEQSHGLNSDRLAYAFIGIRLAEVLNDKELKDFAVNQLQWIFGVNPLAVSMMTCAGPNQGRALEEFLGLVPIPGGIMNGLVGKNGVTPFWAGHWISGEYWLPHSAYYLAAIGDIETFSQVKADSTSVDSDLEIEITVPKKVAGSDDMDVSFIIDNLSDDDISTSLVFAARGSHFAQETVAVELEAGSDMEVVKKAKAEGKRAPCLITIYGEETVLAEEFVFPEITQYVLPKREELRKLKIISVNASSAENDESAVHPENTIDGLPKTRWASAFSDPQWIEIDLGKKMEVKMVAIHWEAAYGQEYDLRISEDGKKWETIYQVDDEDGGLDEIMFPVPVKARYIRILGKQRATPYGYSIFEIEAYGPF